MAATPVPNTRISNARQSGVSHVDGLSMIKNSSPARGASHNGGAHRGDSTDEEQGTGHYRKAEDESYPIRVGPNE